MVKIKELNLGIKTREIDWERCERVSGRVEREGKNQGENEVEE